MKQIISNHNKALCKKNDSQEPTKSCNCRQNKTCSLDGKCLTTGIIYQATVTREDNGKEDTYIGLTDNTFKTRYNGHTSSFNNERSRYSTTLSHHIWSLKDENVPHNIKWKAIKRSNSYSTSSKTCNLCLQEKYFIICKPEMSSLNNRNELASECRHKKRHLLCALKD